MKQNISDEQLSELKDVQRARLDSWIEPRGYSYNLSIGQMIELLVSINGKLPEIQDYRGFALVSFNDGEHHEWTDELLTDALWSAVKQVLKDTPT